jgi:hypothetical protein
MALTRIGLNQSINLASNVTGTLPVANGGTGATSFAPGKVLQTLQMTEGTQASSTSTSFVDTSLTLAITPSATSSKILVFASFTGGNNTSGAGGRYTIERGSTDLSGGNGFNNNNDNCSGYHHNNVMMSYLDSPSTTSATTYTVQMKADSSGSVFINTNSTLGVLILQEIAA